jgi:hypothetical protein
MRVVPVDSLLIDCAAAKINEERASNNGRAPHRIIDTILKSLVARGVKVTRDALNAKCRRLREGNRKIPSEISLSDVSHISGISNSSVNTDSTSSSTPRGRPQGSTTKAKLDLANLKQKAIDQITLDYKAELAKKKETDDRMPKGTLDHIIASTKEELGLPDFEIHKKTIFNRMSSKRKSLTPKHPGTVSVLEDIDTLIIPTAKQMAKIRQPMESQELIEYANSLIDGTIHQTRLIEWKKKHEPCTSDTEEHEENDTHPNDGPTDDSNDENIDDEEAFGPMIEL